MNCTACTRPRTVTLATGSHCCTWCEPYRAECEARAVLALPTREQRQIRIQRIGERRGVDAENNLRGDVMKLWKLQRGE